MSNDLMVAARAFASVPGIDANGLRETSKVAFVAFSIASLTSIGPDTDAKTCTLSVEDRRDYQKTRDDKKVLSGVPNPKRAEPSTLESDSYAIETPGSPPQLGWSIPRVVDSATMAILD